MNLQRRGQVLTCAFAGLCDERWDDSSAEEFLRRFLSHILPAQFRRVRYYGFLVNSQCKEKLIACRALLGFVDPQLPYIADLEAFLERQGIDYSLCASCGEGKMRCVYTVLSFHDRPQCLLEAGREESFAIRVQPPEEWPCPSPRKTLQ
jgi:hypothetical protein